MDRTFALIGHPSSAAAIQRNLEFHKPGHKKLADELLVKFLEWTPSHVASELDEVVSSTGQRRAGVFVLATVMPEMVSLTPQQALQKVVDAAALAERHGAKIAALGGYTSILGTMAADSLLSSVSHSLTTGNTCTVAMAVQQILDISASVGLELKDLDLAVLGGTGDIGSACAELLTPHVGRVTLTARNTKRLARFAEQIERRYGKSIDVTSDNKQAAAQADIVIAATSATGGILGPEDFKPGTIVSDIGYPKNIREVTTGRDDVLVYLGGICQVEHPFDFGYDIDLPARDLLHGCFAEALLLDFEGSYCNYSMGRGNITEDNVAQMLQLGAKHGYLPAPPYQDGQRMLPSDVKRVLSHSHKLN